MILFVFSLKTWLNRDHSSSQSGIINVLMLTNFSKVWQKKKKEKKDESNSNMVLYFVCFKCELFYIYY